MGDIVKARFGAALKGLVVATRAASVAVVAVAAPSAIAWAQEVDTPEGSPEQAPAAASAGEAGKDSETLTGDWGGLRTDLSDAGLKLSGFYTGEALGNPRGGIRQRGVAEGLLEVDLDADLETLVGWKGAIMHASMFQIHGRGLSSNFVGNQLTVRDIEAAPSTRLWALWVQQSFANDAASLRVGQLPEQEEFVVSSLGAYFINGTFGWPIGMAANMPSGGGAYPLAMTAARLKVKLSDETSWMVAVFNGDPAPGSAVQEPDPTRRNRDGLNFSFREPPAYFTEFSHAVNQDKDSPGLPTTYKLGGWYHTGRFNDLRFDDTGRSLADPLSSGAPRQHQGNGGIYGIIDHMLWRRPGTEDVGIGIFTRQMIAPPDRSAMPYYGEVGLTWKGMLEGRDDDVAGIAVAYGATSDRLSGRDRDANAFGTPTAVRDHETAVELLYRAQLTPWWTVIPDVQYIIHPGGGVGLPDDAAQRIPDALVVGLRTVFKL